MPANIKPIKTDENYQDELTEIDYSFMEAYERECFPMPPYDARELRGLMEEYIETIDNQGECEKEFFMTMRDYAEWQIKPFLNWLKSKEV